MNEEEKKRMPVAARRVVEELERCVEETTPQEPEEIDVENSSWSAPTVFSSRNRRGARTAPGTSD